MAKENLSDAELTLMRETVEREFPNDPALQQVHLARKILSYRANENNMTVLQYAAMLSRRTSSAKP